MKLGKRSTKSALFFQNKQLSAWWFAVGNEQQVVCSAEIKCNCVPIHF